MKKYFFPAILGCIVILASCGLGTTGMTSPASTTGSTGTSSSTSSSSAASDAAAILGSIIGQVTGGMTVQSVVGTWVYTQPAVQFESDNLLAQAGGAVAATTVSNKLAPYYKKIGITPGKFIITFSNDGTCQVTSNGRQYPGTYTFDAKQHKLNISSTIFNFPTAYATVSASDLALTFDSTKLLTIAQGVASKSTDATLSSLGSIASSFNGMKTGFTFRKQ